MKRSKTIHYPHAPDAKRRFKALILGLLWSLTAGCTDVQTSVNDLLKPFLPPTPSEAARAALSSHDADERRHSVNLLSAAPFGGEEVYLKMYRLLAEYPDATVRAASLQALGVHGQVDDAVLIAAGLEDEAAMVRWEASRALRKIHNPNVVGALIQTVQKDPDADVRLAAAAALGQYAQPRVFQGPRRCAGRPIVRCCARGDAVVGDAYRRGLG